MKFFKSLWSSSNQAENSGSTSEVSPRIPVPPAGCSPSANGRYPRQLRPIVETKTTDSSEPSYFKDRFAQARANAAELQCAHSEGKSTILVPATHLAASLNMVADRSESQVVNDWSSLPTDPEELGDTESSKWKESVSPLTNNLISDYSSLHPSQDDLLSSLSIGSTSPSRIRLNCRRRILPPRMDSPVHDGALDPSVQDHDPVWSTQSFAMSYGTSRRLSDFGDVFQDPTSRSSLRHSPRCSTMTPSLPNSCPSLNSQPSHSTLNNDETRVGDFTARPETSTDSLTVPSPAGHHEDLGEFLAKMAPLQLPIREFLQLEASFSPCRNDDPVLCPSPYSPHNRSALVVQKPAPPPSFSPPAAAPRSPDLSSRSFTGTRLTSLDDVGSPPRSFFRDETFFDF